MMDTKDAIMLKESKRIYADVKDVLEAKCHYKSGDVLFIDFGTPTTHVQGGVRPAIILGASNILKYDGSPILQVIPLTTCDKFKGVHVEINEKFLKKSFAMPEQLITVDVRQIIGYKGRITKENLKRVKQAVRFQLGI